MREHRYSNYGPMLLFVFLLLSFMSSLAWGSSTQSVQGSLSHYTFIPFKSATPAPGTGPDESPGDPDETADPGDETFKGDIVLAPASGFPHPLTPGKLEQVYEFDLKSLLSAAGSPDPAPDLSATTWEITSGDLPPGLSLDISSGVISGVPTTENEIGNEFVIEATHNNKISSQGYYIVVEGERPKLRVFKKARNTCALNEKSSIARCWGANPYGQLGDNTTVEKLIPNHIAHSWKFSHMSLSGNHTCGIMMDGTVACVGSNSDGILGNGTVTHNRFFVKVLRSFSKELTGVVHIDMGGTHSCAVTSVGGLVCWGLNSSGQVGIHTTTPHQVRYATDVPYFPYGVVRVAAGSGHTCVLTIMGGVMCWGTNYLGEVGSGSDASQVAMPENVSQLSTGVVDVVANASTTCAITVSRGLKCWGRNQHGILGNGTFKGYSNIPVDVAGLSSGVEQVAIGFHHSCAIVTGGTVKCWGLNTSGQLGDGTNINKTTPVDVPDLNDVISIAAGEASTCAAQQSGAVKCWGAGFSGALGNGTTADRYTPTDIYPTTFH